MQVICCENLPPTFTLYFVWETDIKIAHCRMPRIESGLRVDGSPWCPLCPAQWGKGSLCWAS